MSLQKKNKRGEPALLLLVSLSPRRPRRLTSACRPRHLASHPFLVLPLLLVLLVRPLLLVIPSLLVVSPPHCLVSSLSRRVVFPLRPIALVLILVVFVVFVVVGGVGVVVPLRWAGTVVIGTPRNIPNPFPGRWGGGPSS